MRSRRSRAWARRKAADAAAAALRGEAPVARVVTVEGLEVVVATREPGGDWTTISRLKVQDFVDDAPTAAERRRRKAEVLEVLYGGGVKVATGRAPSEPNPQRVPVGPAVRLPSGPVVDVDLAELELRCALAPDASGEG